MSDSDEDRTASLMTPAKLAQLKARPQPAASPAAWLDQLAADAGSGHVRRLVDLGQQLHNQVRERRYGGLTAAVDELAGALGALDFSLVQPRGWLARATGKAKDAVAGYLAQHERILSKCEDLADEVRDLQKKQQAHDTATGRTLMEAEVEVKAIEKIMDQGARWLQDMRGQLKAREAQGGDAAVQQQIADDTRRCELLVNRLKQLRTASSATTAAVERCRAMARSRASVVASLQQLVDGEVKACQGRLVKVAEEVQASGSAEDTSKARKAQEGLQGTLEQAGRDCRGLDSQERLLGEELEALQAPLQAAA